MLVNEFADDPFDVATDPPGGAQRRRSFQTAPARIEIEHMTIKRSRCSAADHRGHG
ncbi:hypothetical protein HLY00_4026 [Mycolicibacterium hippocampi]|uniref:Uncharacterized protein n=1 Tax=Mycolicibacterium hippocampi TaxID=659824 RepID=A0A850Q1Y6_9MYCO|nr:hypothetical protein [Mycolicibacterium hippocampi]